MRVSTCLLAVGLVVLSGLGWCAGVVSHGANAQEPGKPQRLFNGTDLTGWVTPQNKAIFSVENGEIVGRTQGNLKKNEFLVSERTYRDFVLKAKVKFKNGNSGIQFRSKRAADGAVSGPQADVAEGYWGLLYEDAAAESLSVTPRKRRRNSSRTATGTTS